MQTASQKLVNLTVSNNVWGVTIDQVHNKQELQYTQYSVLCRMCEKLPLGGFHRRYCGKGNKIFVFPIEKSIFNREIGNPLCQGQGGGGVHTPSVSPFLIYRVSPKKENY